jgi:hypothetical protein
MNNADQLPILGQGFLADYGERKYEEMKRLSDENVESFNREHPMHQKAIFDGPAFFDRSNVGAPAMIDFAAVRKEIEARIAYAERQTTRPGCIRSAFLRNRKGKAPCDFAGFVLIFARALPDGGGLVHVCDADDWGWQRFTGTLEEAARIFDELVYSDTEYDDAFVEQLRHFGVCRL